MDVPIDFDCKNYKLLNNDLNKLDNDELKLHYLMYGKNEGRLYKKELPIDFNLKIYRILNNDLKDLNDNELENHYLTWGKNEGRIYSEELPFDFNFKNYRKLNNDLANLSDNQLKDHYLTCGKNEQRIYKYNLPEDFDFETYARLNNDLQNLMEDELKEHYLTYGKNEKRLYKIILPSNFNINIYKKNYNDISHLSDKYLEYHYFLNGFIEKRLYDHEIKPNNNDSNCKINFIDAILWINLLKSCDRKIEMKNILNNIDIPNIRINAVNAENLDYYKLINLENENKELSKYEIACTLSHIKAIYKLKNMDGSYFMICEDDISFNNLKYFKKNLEDIIKESPAFDILILNKICDQELNNTYIKWNNSKINFFSTASYIISRNGIKKICDLVEYNADVFIFNKKINVADVFIYKYVDTYVYKYNFIDVNIYDSTINNCNSNK